MTDYKETAWPLPQAKPAKLRFVLGLPGEPTAPAPAGEAISFVGEAELGRLLGSTRDEEAAPASPHKTT